MILPPRRRTLAVLLLLATAACTSPVPPSSAALPANTGYGASPIAPSETPRYHITLVPTPTADPRRLLPHEVDLNCDGRSEFFSFTYQPPAPDHPQNAIAYNQLRFEGADDHRTWGGNGSPVVQAELFPLGDSCEQLLAIFHPEPDIAFHIYRWDGVELITVLTAAEPQQIEGGWNAIQQQAQTPGQPFTIRTRELILNCDPQQGQQTIHRWYQWDGVRFTLTQTENRFRPQCP